MTQYKDIPQATDNRNVSQNDIRQNFNYLCTPAVGGTGTPGILPVDHVATGNNAPVSNDGFHNQVSLIGKAAVISTIVNPISGASSNGILYTKLDAGTAGTLRHQLLYYTRDNATNFTYYLTNLKAAVIFTGSTGAIIGNAYNVTSVTRNSAGDYTVNFTNTLPNTTYMVFVSVEDVGTGNIIGTYNTRNAANVSVGTRSTTTGQVDPTSVSVQVLGFF